MYVGQLAECICECKTVKPILKNLCGVCLLYTCFPLPLCLSLGTKQAFLRHGSELMASTLVNPTRTFGAGLRVT